MDSNRDMQTFCGCKTDCSEMHPQHHGESALVATRPPRVDNDKSLPIPRLRKIGGFHDHFDMALGLDSIISASKLSSQLPRNGFSFQIHAAPLKLATIEEMRLWSTMTRHCDHQDHQDHHSYYTMEALRYLILQACLSTCVLRALLCLSLPPHSSSYGIRKLRSGKGY